MSDKYGLIQDSSGNTSSKRVGGLVLVLVGVLAGFVGAFIGNGLLVDYSKWIAGEGVVLLGLGAFERRA